MDEWKRKDHFRVTGKKGQRHKTNHEALERARHEERAFHDHLATFAPLGSDYSYRKSRCATIVCRVDSLGSKAWQIALKAALFHYLYDDNLVFFEVEVMLEKHERRERCALLELAIWKNNILHSTFAGCGSVQVRI